MDEWKEINIGYNHFLWPQFSKAIKLENLKVDKDNKEKSTQIKIKDLKRSQLLKKEFFLYFKIINNYINDETESFSFYEKVERE